MSLGESERVRVPKAAELVAMRLRKSIVEGELKEGDLLPTEAMLTERYGISRPTLREALRILESEALIEVRRGSRAGAVVRPPKGEVAARYAGFLLEYRGATLSDVFTAAASIESQCVFALATTRTEADLEALRAALAREMSASSMEESLAAQNEFHHLVIQLTGNVTMVALAEMVRHVIDRATTKGLEREGRSERQSEARHKSDQTHRKLLALLEASDADSASELWGRHVRETSRYLEKILDSQAVLDLFD
ncbi:FCD domain-containing protein [Pseudonocardia xishanensis]|uniref:FCD domain-containing protein n=1 Tax=Pseudonocardia xishanensis TaxID=630995 RepID=A0ABP8RH11_9PSEU